MTLLVSRWGDGVEVSFWAGTHKFWCRYATGGDVSRDQWIVQLDALSDGGHHQADDLQLWTRDNLLHDSKVREG